MLSRNLEKTLRRALALANARQHEYATLEHLLMALTEDQDATAVLKACAVDLDRLRVSLGDFLDLVNHGLDDILGLVNHGFGDIFSLGGCRRDARVLGDEGIQRFPGMQASQATHGALLLQQDAHGVGRLCADAEPIECAVFLDLVLRRVGQRVVMADVLHDTAVALVFFLSHDDAIAGLADLSGSTQTNS